MATYVAITNGEFNSRSTWTKSLSSAKQENYMSKKKNRKWSHELAPGMVVKADNPSYRYLVIGLDYEFKSPTQLAFVSIPEYKIQPLRYSLTHNYKVLSRKQAKKWERYTRSDQYKLDELERDAYYKHVVIEQELMEEQEPDYDELESQFHHNEVAGCRLPEEAENEEDDEIRETWQLELGNQGLKLVPPSHSEEVIGTFLSDKDDKGEALVQIGFPEATVFVPGQDEMPSNRN